MITTYDVVIPVLFYEILDVPISELETKKSLIINWRNSKTEIIVFFSFLTNLLIIL